MIMMTRINIIIKMMLTISIQKSDLAQSRGRTFRLQSGEENMEKEEELYVL